MEVWSWEERSAWCCARRRDGRMGSLYSYSGFIRVRRFVQPFYNPIHHFTRVPTERNNLNPPRHKDSKKETTMGKVNERTAVISPYYLKLNLEHFRVGAWNRAHSVGVLRRVVTDSDLRPPRAADVGHLACCVSA